MISELEERVARQVVNLANPGSKLLLAVSGGPDSLALLELMTRTQELHQMELEVVHVDHGINEQSREVARQVAEQADGRGLPFHSRSFELGAGASETKARAVRRTAIRSVVRARGAAGVILAHHADDQIETVLLRVFRGSGPAGLSGMAARRGIWIRPLLEVKQAELRRYLKIRGLSFWQDPANSDPRHLRSWLRTVALPLLVERVPDLPERIQDLARQAASQRRALNSIPEMLVELGFERDGQSISVAAEALRGYRSGVQHMVVAALGRKLGVSLGATKLARIEQLVTSGRSGAMLSLGRHLDAEMVFGRLVLRRPVEVPTEPVTLKVPGQTSLGGFRLIASLGDAPEFATRGGNEASLCQGAYVVRPWRRGDRVRPLGGTGTRSVAALLREAKIASGRRAGWPIVVPSEARSTVVWIPGVCRSEERLPKPGAQALHLECDIA